MRKKTKTTKAAPAPARQPAIKEPYTKSEILATLAEETGLTKRDVSNVLEGLASLIERHIKSRGAGEFKLPGLLKIRTVTKKATKARKGINPFTGEEMMFKAKPARTTVKVSALRKLKSMVE